MSDYQAIYDAVRSRIHGGDIGEAVRQVCYERIDFSHARDLLQQEISSVGYQMARPSTLMRPSLTIDGNQWCALYGANLQDGVAGFGNSPELAMEAFDKAWSEKLPASSIKKQIMELHDHTIAALKSL